MREIKIGNVSIGGGGLTLFAGPCVIEDAHLTMDIAVILKEITTKAGVPFVFKASYDKANRTSLCSFRGPGIKEGLKILAAIRAKIDVPILTDVHRFEDIPAVSEVCDIVQIPAFLCRQTDFVLDVARYAKVINIKKGQFLAPADVEKIIEKVESTGNKNIVITERGASFGYNNLVTDIRALPLMRAFGYPVVFDGTHSVQLPAACGNVSGGDRTMVPYLCRAAVAAGVDGVFLETHPEPSKALCDGANSIQLDNIYRLLTSLKMIDKIAKEVIANG
ncbi:MAG: 3-deoxy-8-phosphooctulonate synthase [Deltaproteobacteria bacterium]|nr:3-deoxy-8-phosphooctulonate synthase [Deltaproteobacteria bacterium]